ncbi:MBOAT family O-acyltransferase [Palleronia sp. KMU-117]|uniref:MBOAT family O-acyltransferase n=1 Tax=Palleronia sp. KMU-117 TaxID=3434108 RepID=UPI003D729B68
MIFSTPIFIFGFLPAFLAIYYVVPRSWRTFVIVAASCVFYGWWKAGYLALVLAIAAVSYATGGLAVRAGGPARKRRWVRLGVSANLVALGWFKYSYFLTGAYDDVAAKFGIESNAALTLPEIVLPIGLSFLVFQSISYIIDVARGDAPPARRLIDFLAFSTLFPQLIAGPILRYKDLAAQIVEREHSLALFTQGAKRFVTGLAMKLLVADSVAPLADRIFALDAPTMAEAWLGALAYSIQLFFDFAGYSAMAIGLGLMIGFRFVENFDVPHISRSITEFWHRWHISLSNWLRDYLYIPLGGNRAGRLATYRNLVLTMALGGLWHGANWTFLLWGLWHGGWMAIERACGIKARGTILPGPVAWPVTMVLVMIGWVMFRAETVGHAVVVYGGMLGLHGIAPGPETMLLTRSSELLFLGVGCLLSVAPAGRHLFAGRAIALRGGIALGAVSAVAPVVLFLLCAVVLQARSDSPFLYFQF